MRTNPEFVARVVADAAASSDKIAAGRHKISKKTVFRYRVRVAADPELAALVQRYIQIGYRRWTAAHDQFLAAALDQLTELVRKAKSIEQLILVASAYQIVAEIQLASVALNVDSNRADPGEAIPQAGRLVAAAALPPRRSSRQGSTTLAHPPPPA